jgi:transposase
MRRGALGSFVTSLRRCVVAMEACCGAHHLGRGFAAQGHEVRLMSPEYVRPYGAPRRRVLPVEEESTQRVVD